MPVMMSLRVGSLVAAIVVAGMSVAMPAPTSASTCQSWGSQPPTAANGDHGLNAVTTTSPCNAWAVGEYFAESVENTLVEHWNGTSWSLQFSPNPDSMHNYLNGVAATSATNAWAVGAIGDQVPRTLIEHWNGTTWSTASSRNVGSSSNELAGVAAISASNVWAVGDYYDQNTSQERTLIQRWNGTDSVSLIEHWNGTAWSVQPSPNPGIGAGGGRLSAVAASSSTNAWAVGEYRAGGLSAPLALHCC